MFLLETLGLAAALISTLRWLSWLLWLSALALMTTIQRLLFTKSSSPWAIEPVELNCLNFWYFVMYRNKFETLIRNYGDLKNIAKECKTALTSQSQCLTHLLTVGSIIGVGLEVGHGHGAGNGQLWARVVNTILTQLSFQNTLCIFPSLASFICILGMNQ